MLRLMVLGAVCASNRGLHARRAAVLMGALGRRQHLAVAHAFEPWLTRARNSQVLHLGLASHSNKSQEVDFNGL